MATLQGAAAVGGRSIVHMGSWVQPFAGYVAHMADMAAAELPKEYAVKHLKLSLAGVELARFGW